MIKQVQCKPKDVGSAYWWEAKQGCDISHSNTSGTDSHECFMGTTDHQVCRPYIDRSNGARHECNVHLRVTYNGQATTYTENGNETILTLPTV